MTERPILFSCDMVKALLAGRTTQTVRGYEQDPAHVFCRSQVSRVKSAHSLWP